MIDLHLFEFPLSLALTIMFLLCIVGLRKTPVAAFFGHRTFSSVLMAVIAVMMAVEGTWAFRLFHHWTFVTLILLAIISIGFAAVSDWKRKSYCALMSHSGLFLVLSGGLFGAPDVIESQITVFSDGQEQCLACNAEGYSVQLPFSIMLKDFSIDYYEDGESPKQYTSCLSIDGRQLRTSVNHPCRYRGYRIYQSGYDARAGNYSTLELVRDPWLPVLAVGALLLALSAILSLKKTWKSWKMLIAALVLAAVFTVVSVAGISFGTLPPALRSLWFVPHLIVYMLAYAVMALSVITGLASLVSDRIPEHLSGKLLSTASSLLLIGMLCGAVWAQQAWGSYWTWDAKECWAAVTWLLTLAGMHLPKKKAMLLFIVLAFLAIQVTWYGVNYLPSSAQSLHTYNQNLF